MNKELQEKNEYIEKLNTELNLKNVSLNENQHKIIRFIVNCLANFDIFAIKHNYHASTYVAEICQKLRENGHYAEELTDEVITRFSLAALLHDIGKVKEISAFIVEKDTPGFSFGTKEKKMGIRGSSTYELIFEDCRIPKENLLGAKGKGFGIAMHTLDGGRIGIAAQALGLAEGALEATIEYVKERKQFGRSIAQFQNTQFQLADMAARVEAAKLLVYKAAKAKETQKVYSVEAAMAKLFAAETAMEVTTKAVQLHGGYGYIREYDVERMMRDAKITEIYEGTSEVQRMVISGSLLK